MSAAANVFDFNTAARSDNLPAPQDNDRRLDDLRSTLRSRAKDVVRDVFPHARIIGHTARIGDLGGAPGESLAIEISGDKAGLWMDHATAESGDLIDLWTATQGYTGDGGFWQAVDDLELHLGLSTGVAWNGPVAKVAEARKRQPAPGPVSKTLEAEHVYTDTYGARLGMVKRFRLSDGGKTFMQFNAQGEPKAPAEPRPLYLLPSVVPANTVVLVEGERKAERLSALGVEATTAMGGAKAPLDKTDWSPLAGKRIIIWPDNDEPGLDYAARLEPHLRALGCQVVRVSIPIDKPAKWDAYDATDDEALAILRGALSRFVEASSRRNRLLSIDDLAHRKPVEWLIEGMVPESSYASIVGDAGTMKSFVAIAWGLSIAHGVPWLGRPVKQGRVVYVAAEGQAGLYARLAAHQEAFGLRGPAPFHIFDQPVAVPTPELDELLADIRDLPEPPRLIVLDTLAWCFGPGDENSQKDMNAFNAAVARLKRETGACVLVVHHTGKSGDVRGSTALRGAVDVMMVMERLDRSLTLSNGGKIGKQKDAEPFADVALTYNAVSFIRADGEAGGSVVLVEDDDARAIDPDAAPRQRRARAFGPKPKPLRDATVEFFKQAPGRDFAVPTLQGALPGTRSGIWKVLRALVEEGVLTMSGDPDRLLYRLSDGGP